MKRGKLIAFEGIDGCGKTTQLRRLAAGLRASGADVVATFEPTTGEMGQRIRAMARSGDSVPPETELDWFLTDRREHVETVVEPQLAAGKWVLCDRYTLSSVAYQGARGLDWRSILERSESDFPRPDLVLLFEVPAALGLERVTTRGGVLEPQFEEQDFLEQVARIFSELDCDYIERIDARPDPDNVTQKTVQALERRLGVRLEEQALSER